MYLPRYLLLIFIILVQSCATSANQPERKIAFLNNCSKHLADAIDLDTYKERIYAKNVLDYHKYKSGKITISKKYSKDTRYDALSKDPDHNYKVTMTSMLEAVSGIEAEKLGLIPPPIARGPPGSEFIDGKNNLWDVKTPISPLRIHGWNFQAEVAGNSILKKLRKNKNMRILLNKSFMSYQDKEALSQWLKINTPRDLKHRIIEVYFPSPFQSNK